MKWSTFHKRSERYACKAEVALHKGDVETAKTLYQKAAENEQRSLEYLDPSTQARTLGICVVSAAALWYKANQTSVAHEFISHWLKKESLPEFAIKDLKTLHREIKTSPHNREHQHVPIRRTHSQRPSPKPFSSRATRPKVLA